MVDFDDILTLFKISGGGFQLWVVIATQILLNS